MTTAAAETIDGDPDERPGPGRPAAAVLERLRVVPTSLRTRILGSFLGVLALATALSVFVTHEVLLIRLDQRIDADLTQEAAELRRIASRNDPFTGKTFGRDVRRIFRTYLQRNVPSRNEALITFVEGRPYLRSAQVVPYRLDTDPTLVARWADIPQPDRGRVQTPAGRVEYLAVPLWVEGRTAGVFVAAVFAERAESDVDSVVHSVGAVGLSLLLLGSLLALRLADRLVQPVSTLTRTAKSISETDLDARIPVRGRDEVAELAVTFNEMLDRLEEAFSSQRRFADDAGHELKTPLTIVRGHLELLHLRPEARQQTIALVLDEVDRMARIVDDLLLLAKHERPDFLTLAPVDVTTLTREIFAKARALAPRRWVLEECGSGSIVADRQRLTQAMIQVAENAARYGDPAETIALGSLITGPQARFWVTNRGPGIAPAERALIFERFHRGEVTHSGEGAGLGLSIVKAIAEAHGGSVEVEAPDEGDTTFAIVVPVDGGGGAEERSS